MAEKPTEDVIPLSRFRAALARARRGRRADALAADSDGRELVRRLPVQELYYAIRELGLSDAEELLVMATPDQVQGLVDIDAWQRERFDENRFSEWVEVLIAAGPEPLARVIDGLDPELVALYIQRQTRVYDLTIETPPDEPVGHYYPTPDRFFMLDIYPSAGGSLERMIDWLYRADLDLARRVVMSAKWELASDLEEWSYRWRSGRMSDLGYVDYYDALEIYRFIDPASVHIGEASAEPPDTGAGRTALPALLAGPFEHTGLLAQALAAVTDEAELDRLYARLVKLSNAALAAARIEPADLEAAAATLERTVAYLDLGLEYLVRSDRRASESDTERARRALESVALARIFRVGFSLTLQLRRLADTLVERGRVGLAERSATLLEPPADAIVAGLRSRWPVYPRELEGESGTRPFRTLADIARAAAALEETAQMAGFVWEGLGVSRGELISVVDAASIPAEEVRFGTVVRTLAAQVLLGRPLVLEPLPAGARAALARQLASAELAPSERAAVEAAFAAELDARGVHPPAGLARFLDRWLGGFGGLLAQPHGLLIQQL